MSLSHSASQTTPHRRRPDEQHAALRRLTLMATIAATFLNGALFAQAGSQYVSVGDLQQGVVRLLNTVLPGGTGIQTGGPISANPGSARPIVVSGGS